MVDRGANGGLAGSDVRILSRSSIKCTVTGIDSHELQGLDVVQCAALVETNHEFALKFRVIADSRGYEDTIDGTATPPPQKEIIDVLPDDKPQELKAKNEKLAARLANKKGHRDFVMSTEGISLNFDENATSDK